MIILMILYRSVDFPSVFLGFHFFCLDSSEDDDKEAIARSKFSVRNWDFSSTQRWIPSPFARFLINLA